MVNIPIPFINRSRDPPLTDRERIENFLIEVGDRYKSHFSFTDLNDLFKWGRRTWKEKTDLEVVNSKLGHDLDRVNGEASRLGHQLKKTQEQLEQAVVRISYLDEDTKKLKLEREEAKKRWEQQTEQERRAHRAEMHSKMAAYERKIGDLKADIMINQKDSKAWTDEKLKKWLNDLRLRVQDIAPNWLTIDEQSGVPARLDPTGFIARAGRHEYPFLVRSTIWAVLLEHFFAVPFGFGALGPQGRRPLFEAYRAWRTFFDAGIDQEGELMFQSNYLPSCR
jgi:hypothetical protein